MTLLSEELALVATIDPDAYGTGAQNTDWIAMKDHNQVIFAVLAGTIATSGTLDFTVQQATSSTGASAKAVSGTSITQLTTGDNDKQVLVNVRVDDLDVANDFDYIRGVMTHGTAGGDSAVVAFGGKSRYLPASDLDLASVDEIVTS